MKQQEVARLAPRFVREGDEPPRTDIDAGIAVILADGGAR